MFCGPPLAFRRNGGELANRSSVTKEIRCKARAKPKVHGEQEKPLEQNSNGQQDASETRKMQWLRWWWPAILWAIVISLFSTGTFTSENTGRVIIPALHRLFPHLSIATLGLIHHYIRKTGHLIEYFILSLFFLRGIRGERKGMRFGWALAAIGIVLCYASLDEFHQFFVPGRTPAVTDVMLDTCGGILAQLVGFLTISLHSQEQRRETVTPEKGAVSLWNLLNALCFVVPISGSIASSCVTKAGFGGYALAIVIGLALGVGCGWTMFKAGRSIAERIKKQRESMQERYFRALYIAAILWIVVALFLGAWVSRMALRLAV